VQYIHAIVNLAKPTQPLSLYTHRIIAAFFVGRRVKNNYAIIFTKFVANLSGRFLLQRLMKPRRKTYESLQRPAIPIVAVGNRLDIFLRRSDNSPDI